MNKEVKIFLPKLGESILSATILQWFKKEGDNINVDEPLLEVTTDKVTTEIPSPVAGIVKEIKAQEDEEVKIGDLLAIIITKKQKEDSSSNSIEKKNNKIFKEEKSSQGPSSLKKTFDVQAFLSPAAKALVTKYSLSIEDLEKVNNTSFGDRISQKDIENYIATRQKRSKKTEEDSIKMSSMRKTIAKEMEKSSQNIPAASLAIEIDVTKISQFIKNKKEYFYEKYETKLTITSFLVKAITDAILLYPYMNSTLKDETIILKKNINLGIAINIEKGLVVPKIKNCEKKNISEIAICIADLKNKAINNTLKIEDMNEGTITMSNFGMEKVFLGIPIIKYPEAAIIGVGMIDKKVVALDDNSFAIRDIMTISLTFDHRIIDGIYACKFVNEIKKYLENHWLSFLYQFNETQKMCEIKSF